MHFDPLNGDLWIGDVGQGAWEEIDVARAGVGGLDYGWNTMEGAHCYQPATGCDQAGADPAGLRVRPQPRVRGHRRRRGRGRGRAVVRRLVLLLRRLLGQRLGDRSVEGRVPGPDPVLDSGRSISAFGEDADGNVYLTDLGSGALLRRCRRAADLSRRPCGR